MDNHFIVELFKDSIPFERHGNRPSEEDIEYDFMLEGKSILVVFRLINEEESEIEFYVDGMVSGSQLANMKSVYSLLSTVKKCIMDFLKFAPKIKVLSFKGNDEQHIRFYNKITPSLARDLNMRSDTIKLNSITSIYRLIKKENEETND